MTKIIKGIGILLAVVVILLIIAGVVIMLVVDKEMVAGKIEKMLNRQVRIAEVDIGLLSAVSGIELKGLRISNFKTPEKLTSLEGKPIADKDLFVGLDRLNFKIKLLPLLSGKVELKELMLYEPAINIVKYKNGRFNFSDRLESKKEEVPPSPPQKAEEAVPPKKSAEGPEEKRLFSADDLPVSIALGKIGLDKGTLNYKDSTYNQTFQVYGLTTMIHDAEIDPKALDKKDSAGIKIDFGIKPVGKVKSGSVNFFDIVLSAKGKIIPFDQKTRRLDPEIILDVGSDKGTITGLQIFDALNSVQGIRQYTGDLAFLKDEVKWNSAYLDVWYKADKAKFSTGKITTDDYDLTFDGTTNIKTKALKTDLGVVLNDKESNAIRTSITKEMARNIRGDLAKYVKPERVTDLVMKRLNNAEGKVTMKFEVSGTIQSPKSKLLQPSLPKPEELIKEVAGDAGNIIKDVIREEAGKEIEKAADKLFKKLKF